LIRWEEKSLLGFNQRNKEVSGYEIL